MKKYYWMMTQSLKIAALLLLWVFSVSAMADVTTVLTQSEWSKPRSGQAVLNMPPVNKAVKAWMLNRDTQRIQLRYASSDKASAWAEELRGWLVALGVPSHAIEMKRGAVLIGVVQLHVAQKAP